MKAQKLPIGISEKFLIVVSYQTNYSKEIESKYKLFGQKCERSEFFHLRPSHMRSTETRNMKNKMKTLGYIGYKLASLQVSLTK